MAQVLVRSTLKRKLQQALPSTAAVETAQQTEVQQRLEVEQQQSFQYVHTLLHSSVRSPHNCYTWIMLIRSTKACSPGVPAVILLCKAFCDAFLHNPSHLFPDACFKNTTFDAVCKDAEDDYRNCAEAEHSRKKYKFHKMPTANDGPSEPQQDLKVLVADSHPGVNVFLSWLVRSFKHNTIRHCNRSSFSRVASSKASVKGLLQQPSSPFFRTPRIKLML